MKLIDKPTIYLYFDISTKNTYFRKDGIERGLTYIQIFQKGNIINSPYDTITNINYNPSQENDKH